LNKIVLTTLALSAFLFADSSTDTTREQIEAKRAQIAKLQAELQKLQSSLPVSSPKVTKVQKDQELKLHTEFGFIETKGNTDTLNTSIDAKAQKKFGVHEFTFLGDGEYTEEKNSKTKNKYFLELDYGHKISRDVSFEYITAYKYDEFSGYDYRFYTGPGLKVQLFKDDVEALSLSNAILFSRDDRVSDGPYNYTSYRAKAEYTRQLFKNLKFDQILSYQTDVTSLKDFFLYSKTGLSSKISDIFSVGLNYKYDYVNAPDRGKQKADRTLSANLIADF
jgi:putative salt-induced outer membrane protein YdiY